MEHNVDAQTSLWGKIAAIILILGSLAAGILWLIAKGSIHGQDVAILTLCITFAASIAAVSIRELYRAGR